MFLSIPQTMAFEGIDNSVLEFEDVIFQPSVSNMPDEVENRDAFTPIHASFSGNSYKSSDTDPNRMPFFKQMRLRSTYKYRELTSDNRKANKSERRGLFGRKQPHLVPVTVDVEQEKPDGAILNTIDNVANIETSDVSLEAGISEEQVEKQLMLDAVNINYDNTTGLMVATGRPILFLPPQEVKVIADKMTYDDQGNILNAEGNVVVIKNGKETKCDYLVVNLNEETIDADNMFAEFPKLNITAEHGTQQDGLLIFNKGTMFSDNDYVYHLKTQVVGPKISDMIINEDERELFFGKPEHTVDVQVRSLEIDAKKNHDVIKAKGIKIGSNGKTENILKVITLNSVHTEK